MKRVLSASAGALLLLWVLPAAAEPLPTPPSFVKRPLAMPKPPPSPSKQAQRSGGTAVLTNQTFSVPQSVMKPETPGLTGRRGAGNSGVSKWEAQRAAPPSAATAKYNNRLNRVRIEAAEKNSSTKLKNRF